MTNKNHIDELRKEDVQKLGYQNENQNNYWKIGFIKEITDLKFNQLEVDNFSKEELDEILTFLCTS